MEEELPPWPIVKIEELKQEPIKSAEKIELKEISELYCNYNKEVGLIKAQEEVEDVDKINIYKEYQYNSFF